MTPSSMRKPASLITGAGGEIGHGLIRELARRGEREILALDLYPMDESLSELCTQVYTGDILDASLLQRIVTRYEIQEIYHLAALLSTRAEYAPAQAQKVNVEGTLNLFELAQSEGSQSGTPVRFLFPSSIAVYGMGNVENKMQVGRVREDDFLAPITMYGCNKLTCEHLGRYFSFHYQQLAKEPQMRGVDFRALRFPGLVSSETLPSGGTSDYAPEMVHRAAEGKPYACFVDESATIPFMAMPDAIRTLTMLADAPCRISFAPQLQRRGHQPQRRRDQAARPAPLPRCRSQLRSRRGPRPHRRQLAGRCGRQRRTRRLGLEARLRRRAHVRRVSGPRDPRQAELRSAGLRAAWRLSRMAPLRILGPCKSLSISALSGPFCPR
jgi:threonine 3-dehydrogenase